MIILRPFIHGGKDQHKSCTAHHGEPLLCPCLRTHAICLGYFSGLGNVAFTLKQRARIMVGLDHPTFRLRGGDVTTSPPLPKMHHL